MSNVASAISPYRHTAAPVVCNGRRCALAWRPETDGRRTPLRKAPQGAERRIAYRAVGLKVFPPLSMQRAGYRSPRVTDNADDPGPKEPQ